MSISTVSAPPPTPPASPVKAPDQSDVRKADVQNGGAADGTRTPQPTVLPSLPPGQGTRVDQFA